MVLVIVKNLLWPSSGQSQMPAGSTGPLLGQRCALGSPADRAYGTVIDSEDLEAQASASSSDSEETFVHPSKEPQDSDRLSSNQLRARLIADATIGLSDGLTVPFALTAGLSALGNSNIVVYGGLAELIAGAISMGLGGYLGSRSEAEGYYATLSETQDLVRQSPDEAAALVIDSFKEFDLPPDTVNSVVSALTSSQDDQMAQFLMRFHHMQQPSDFTTARAYISAATIAAGYFIGGFIPLLPYFFVNPVSLAFMYSASFMAIALFVFGFGKTRLVGETSLRKCLYSGIQMVILGGLAAAAAMGLVTLLAKS